MLRILDPGRTFCDGITRREWLRLGGIGLGGLTLDQLLATRAQAAPARRGRARSVIVFGLVGGPPQHETWDPKPLAPAEIRGQFGTIATRTPGLRVGELMPRTARLTDKIAVLRAVATNDNAHSSSGYQMLTGVPHVPLNQESATPKPPNNWPAMGAVLRALRNDTGQLPAAVTLPEHIWNDGNFPWPGQDAGFLGARYNPWLIHCDPSDPALPVPSLSLPGEIPAVRFDGRRTLLDQVNRHFEEVQRGGVVETFSRHMQKATELLHSTAARQAFDLGREPAALRERYGSSRFAQSCLLARRLVEAGVGLVQINWTRIKDQPNQGGWDTHGQHNKSLQSLLMPIMDQAFSALLEDLDVRGLLDETLVVWFGEFGRTPRFNGNAGRDHWGHCFSLALAGGGIRGGVVHGMSDKQAAYPLDGRVEARDLLATIYHCLGYDPGTEVHDSQNRPVAISRGQVIRAIV
ncbi:MAG: DUF1501 domain-containing protein [Gemmataceae bacterium]